MSCVRLGLKKDVNGKHRPIKCSLSSTVFVSQILRNAARLRDSELYKSVYISPDRTAEERSKRRQLVEQYKMKKDQNPDINYRIDFKNNNLVERVNTSSA